MKKFFFFFLLILLVPIYLLLGADKAKKKEASPEYERGKKLYKRHGCHTCHGPTGKVAMTPMYPIIAGQNPEYSTNQMKDIKSGRRNNGLSMTMRSFLMRLSEEDLKAISLWLSKQK